MIWIQFLATALARAVILVDDGFATGSGILLPLMSAERTVNGMEALIEMARQRELVKDSSAAPPASPRDAVARNCP